MKSGSVYPILLLLFPALTLSCGGKKQTVEMYRERMVRTQIEARGISDPRVLAAMRAVPRHDFATGYRPEDAYADMPLPIGHGQTISQPYIVALMTQECELSGTEKVLEIGTGSGYQAAVLSLLAREVYSIEILESLALSARSHLEKQDYKNIHLRTGDGYAGWKEHCPFDVIILTAAPPVVPEELMLQLKSGGILIAPVGTEVQSLVKITKNPGGNVTEHIEYVRFVPMVRSAPKTAGE